MNKELVNALNNLYAVNKEYDDFASRAPIGYNPEIDAKVDEYDKKIFDAEEAVYQLNEETQDEDEAYAVQSLMYQWHRIPRYLEHHAA